MPWFLITALPWIKNNILLLVAVAAAGGLFLYGDHAGAARVQSKWDADKLAQQEAIDAAKDEKIKQDRAAAEISTKVGGDYEKNIASVSAGYAALHGVLFRKIDAPGGDTGGFSRSASGVDQRTIAPGCAAGNQKNLARIAKLKKQLVTVGQEHDDLLVMATQWRAWYAEQVANSKAGGK